MPKFHVSFCATLDRMRRDQRFQRYVVANRDDGTFTVNLMHEAGRSEVVPLSVCQFCLQTIAWKGFRGEWERQLRAAAVKDFKLSEFFVHYPRDLLHVRPDHTTDTAPINDYAQDWGDVSERVKRQRAFRCEACKRSLSMRQSRFLHVHHTNGLKYDNDDQNLEVLCIGCHAEKPRHSHLKALPDYRDYLAWIASSYPGA